MQGQERATRLTGTLIPAVQDRVGEDVEEDADDRDGDEHEVRPPFGDLVGALGASDGCGSKESGFAGVNECLKPCLGLTATCLQSRRPWC